MLNLLKSKIVKCIGIICLALITSLILVMLSDFYVKTKVPIGLYGYNVFTDSWEDGHVSLEGTWVIEDEKSAFPLQISKIICNKDNEICTESIAKISGATLVVSQDSHNITEWSFNNLIYKSSSQCVDYIYSVNRETKQVTGIRTSNTTNDSFCSEFENKELKLRLTNGFDTYLQMTKDATPVKLNIICLILILIITSLKIRIIIKS